MFCTSQFQNCPSPPERFQDIFYFFLSNSPVCWQCTWSNTPPASTSESVKSSTEWPFNNFPTHQTVYSKCEHPAKHSWNILSLRKLFYSGLFIKICHSRNPTFNRPFKRLSNAPTNTEYWSNVLHMLNAERITKSFCLQRWPEFWHESQMPYWAFLILGQIIHCVEQNSSQMPREGGWAVLELHSRLCKRKAGMLSQERIVNKILYRPFLWSKWIFLNLFMSLGWIPRFMT